MNYFSVERSVKSRVANHLTHRYLIQGSKPQTVYEQHYLSMENTCHCHSILCILKSSHDFKKAIRQIHGMKIQEVLFNTEINTSAQECLAYRELVTGSVYQWATKHVCPTLPFFPRYPVNHCQWQDPRLDWALVWLMQLFFCSWRRILNLLLLDIAHLLCTSDIRYTKSCKTRHHYWKHPNH